MECDRGKQEEEGEKKCLLFFWFVFEAVGCRNVTAGCGAAACEGRTGPGGQGAPSLVPHAAACLRRGQAALFWLPRWAPPIPQPPTGSSRPRDAVGSFSLSLSLCCWALGPCWGPLVDRLEELYTILILGEGGGGPNPSQQRAPRLGQDRSRSIIARLSRSTSMPTSSGAEGSPNLATEAVGKTGFLPAVSSSAPPGKPPDWTPDWTGRLPC